MRVNLGVRCPQRRHGSVHRAPHGLRWERVGDPQVDQRHTQPAPELCSVAPDAAVRPVVRGGDPDLDPHLRALVEGADVEGGVGLPLERGDTVALQAGLEQPKLLTGRREGDAEAQNEGGSRASVEVGDAGVGQGGVGQRLYLAVYILQGCVEQLNALDRAPIAIHDDFIADIERSNEEQEDA